MGLPSLVSCGGNRKRPILCISCKETLSLLMPQFWCCFYLMWFTLDGRAFHPCCTADHLRWIMIISLFEVCPPVDKGLYFLAVHHFSTFICKSCSVHVNLSHNFMCSRNNWVVLLMLEWACLTDMEHYRSHRILTWCDLALAHTWSFEWVFGVRICALTHFYHNLMIVYNNIGFVNTIVFILYGLTCHHIDVGIANVLPTPAA